MEIKNMEVKSTILKDCYEVIPKRFGDERGYFDSLTIEQLRSLGFSEFHQKSQSFNYKKGTLRGMHFQKDPYCQAKLVGCLKGSILDVVVDCRYDSPTYGQWTSVALTPEKENYLYVPAGFAHGYIALTDNAKFIYFVDNSYNTKKESGIVYNDPNINIPWRALMDKYDIDTLILKDRDKSLPTLEKCDAKFSCQKPKILIAGYKGQLGYDVVKMLENHGLDRFLALGSDRLDLTNREQVMDVVKRYNPDVIIDCAAYTKVDKAENDEANARKVNINGTHNLVDASIEVGAKIIYISTDYVFDGKKDGAYTEEDKADPLNVYGMTKLGGELEVKRNPHHFIVRTSWVFGINGSNFILTMLKLSQNHKEVKVVDDQIGSPTYTVDLSRVLMEMIYSEDYGTYHVTNDGYCSWAELCEYAYNINGIDTRVIPVSTEEYIKGKEQAMRPLNSRLDKTKLENTFGALPTWQEGVDNYCRQLRKKF